MDEVDFSKLKDCLTVDSDGVTYEESMPECDDKLVELREHFLEFLPDGYSTEEIEKMSKKQLLELENYIDDNHCLNINKLREDNK